MLNAIKLDKDYHQLLELIVCSRDRKECIIHRCPNCSGIEPLKNYLREQLKMRSNDQDESDADTSEEDSTFTEEEEEDYEITLCQWTSTDRAELIKQSAPVLEFVDLVAEKLDKITVHSFIARTQGKYLKQCKENLKEDEVIVLVDFAENYKFLVQDEIQGYHWNKSQCTLHPAVMYTKEDGQLKDHSICFTSDDLNHFVDMVYQILKETTKQVIEDISPQVKTVNYFSDGCAGQYKNCKNFLNLCFHCADFGIGCMWSFFATSHGKSTCNGIGGTVKRITSGASLQRPFDSQILIAIDMFKFCNEEIKGIKFKFISKETMEVTRASLKTRLLDAKTVPGTRSYHHIVPLSGSCIGMKRTLTDEYASKFDFALDIEQIYFNPSLNSFGICLYDGEYWIGLVEEIDSAQQDIKVKFMHPKCRARSYLWPDRDDICWVPEDNVLHNINAPITATGRQYKLLAADEESLPTFL